RKLFRGGHFAKGHLPASRVAAIFRLKLAGELAQSVRTCVASSEAHSDRMDSLARWAGNSFAFLNMQALPRSQMLLIQMRRGPPEPPATPNPALLPAPRRGEACHVAR